jgi:hypothetical protein
MAALLFNTLFHPDISNYGGILGTDNLNRQNILQPISTGMNNLSSNIAKNLNADPLNPSYDSEGVPLVEGVDQATLDELARQQAREDAAANTSAKLFDFSSLLPGVFSASSETGASASGVSGNKIIYLAGGAVALIVIILLLKKK